MSAGFKQTILDNKLCSGCGVCTAVNESMSVSLDEVGQLIASYSVHQETPLETKICPFSDASKNENKIAEELFTEHKQAPYVGKYLACYVGHVIEGRYRELGASGGFGRWVNAQLLERGEVDYVVHVTQTSETDNYFEYHITKNSEDLLSTARSAYYPVTMEAALKFILETDARFAITAVPCFARALRNLADVEPRIKQRIRFVIGIICGHLKTTEFAQSLALQVGVQPSELATVDFRHKLEGKKANEKGFVAFKKVGSPTQPVNTRELLGGDWGHGLFKYRACDYCDDVLAETADIAIGDAWLPEYMDDSKGKSVVVVRHPVLLNMLSKSADSELVALKEVAPEVVVKSQAGGIRHRNEGLAQRLHDDQRKGLFTPKKRVQPAVTKDPAQRYKYRFRVKTREASHEIFERSKRSDGTYDVDIYRRATSNLVSQSTPALWRRVISKVIGKFNL